MIQNFPNRPAALKLKAMVFPLGARFKRPADSLDIQVAKLFSTDSEIRRRFIGGLFLADSDTNIIGKLNVLLQQADIMDILNNELQEAVRSGRLPDRPGPERINAAAQAGIISRDEADKLLDFEAKVLDIVQVDDFPFEHSRHDTATARAAK